MKLETKLADAMRKRHGLKDGSDVREMQTGLTVQPIADDPYRFTARITTDAVDRQDEVVIPAGGQFGEFLNSGAIFWNHEYDRPVGFPDKDKRIVRGESFVEAGGVFMRRPANFDGEFFPDFVREFVNQAAVAGINPGVSIGFIPIETRRPSKADIQKYGDGVQVVHAKWKLLEFSIAPVQANQEAVVIAVGKGIISPKAAKAVGFNFLIDPPAPKPQRVIKCALMVTGDTPKLDLDAIIQKEFKRSLYRKFGRLFMPV